MCSPKINRPSGMQPMPQLKRTASQPQQTPKTQQTPQLQRSASMQPSRTTLQVQRHQEMTSPQQQEKLVNKLLNKQVQPPVEQPKLQLMSKRAPKGVDGQPKKLPDGDQPDSPQQTQETPSESPQVQTPTQQVKTPEQSVEQV
ncbi:MAG: hypothetical protein ACAI44_30645, partial [Candidatus Sericytochromatia bacterium]